MPPRVLEIILPSPFLSNIVFPASFPSRCTMPSPTLLSLPPAHRPVGTDTSVPIYASRPLPWLLPTLTITETPRSDLGGSASILVSFRANSRKRVPHSGVNLGNVLLIWAAAIVSLPTFQDPRNRPKLPQNSRKMVKIDCFLLKIDRF